MSPPSLFAIPHSQQFKLYITHYFFLCFMTQILLFPMLYMYNFSLKLKLSCSKRWSICKRRNVRNKKIKTSL